RDLIVTGVQTCALPISPAWPTPFRTAPGRPVSARPAMTSPPVVPVPPVEVAAGAPPPVEQVPAPQMRIPELEEAVTQAALREVRSEERRVGKECRCGWV